MPPLGCPDIWRTLSFLLLYNFPNTIILPLSWSCRGRKILWIALCQKSPAPRFLRKKSFALLKDTVVSLGQPVASGDISISFLEPLFSYSECSSLQVTCSPSVKSACGYALCLLLPAAAWHRAERLPAKVPGITPLCDSSANNGFSHSWFWTERSQNDQNIHLLASI